MALCFECRINKKRTPSDCFLAILATGFNNTLIIVFPLIIIIIAIISLSLANYFVSLKYMKRSCCIPCVCKRSIILAKILLSDIIYIKTHVFLRAFRKLVLNIMVITLLGIY